MSEYIKGDCLDTKKKFVGWLAQDKPYVFSSHTGEEFRVESDSNSYNGWLSDFIRERKYFEAIEKPAPVKATAYKDDTGCLYFYAEGGDFRGVPNIPKGFAAAPEYDIYYLEY